MNHFGIFVWCLHRMFTGQSLSFSVHVRLTVKRRTTVPQREICTMAIVVVLGAATAQG